MNTDNMDAKRKRLRIWGWILVIIGGLFSLIDIYIMFTTSITIFNYPEQANTVPYVGYTRDYGEGLVVNFYLPGLLVGISLLILGIWLINSVIPDKKRNNRRSWGWVLSIMGGLYVLVFITNLGVNVKNWGKFGKLPLFEICFTPMLILGILGLVYGIRNINRKEIIPPTDFSGLDNPQGDEKDINTENKVINGKGRKTWGWILTIVGGLFACFGLYITVSFIADVAPTITVKELLKNILGLILYVPALPIGTVLLLIGIRLINRKEKTPEEEEELRRKNNRTWGWILTIVGGLFLLLVVGVGINTIIPYYYGENTEENLFDYFFCYTPLLLVGILSLIFGIRLIIRTGKNAPVIPGSLDNSQG